MSINFMECTNSVNLEICSSDKNKIPKKQNPDSMFELPSDFPC